jgi:hypothetical protein
MRPERVPLAGRWFRSRAWAWRLAAFAAVACAGSDATGPDPAIAPFVGDWNATSLILTSQANPEVSPDLITLGATFSLNVQESGQYTAILLYASQAQTEIGHVTVSGSAVTLHREFPSAGTTAGVYEFQGNRLVLDGETEFDFNLDGTPEPALVHLEFVRK